MDNANINGVAPAKNRDSGDMPEYNGQVRVKRGAVPMCITLRVAALLRRPVRDR